MGSLITYWWANNQLRIINTSKRVRNPKDWFNMSYSILVILRSIRTTVTFLTSPTVTPLVIQPA